MTVRWGIVGFGWVARDYMAPAIAAAGHRLATVCDPDPDARAAAEALGASANRELGVCLAGADAVYVATPNHLHRPVVEAAASAGKAVLCEKPMATTVADAEAMAAACRRAGVLYGTAFDQRHHPAHEAMRDLIARGRIGRATAVRIVYACWVGPDWSACRDHGAAPRENWRIDPAKAGGGALIDLAPHGLDLVEYLLGEPVAEVVALMQRQVQPYPVDDGALLMGRTTSGTLVSLHVAYNCPEALPRRRLEVVGESGQLLAEDTMGQDPGGSVVLIDGATGAHRPVPFEAASPFLRQVLAFGRAVATGGPGPFSIDRDLHTMRLLAEAARSAGARLPSARPVEEIA